jgi:hypothetical protein
LPALALLVAPDHHSVPFKKHRPEPLILRAKSLRAKQFEYFFFRLAFFFQSRGQTTFFRKAFPSSNASKKNVL